MERSKVIVIGGNHHNTLGVVRSLGYKEIRPHIVIVTNNKKPYVCYSKYIVRYQILSSAGEIVDYLLSIKDNTTKRVVISCADFVTAVLDSHQNELSAYYYLPVGKGNVELVMNKDTMSRIANECGISTPRNLPLNEVTFDKSKKYILKPLKSIEDSKADIAIVKSKEELDDYLSFVHYDNLQIREFVEKSWSFN